MSSSMDCARQVDPAGIMLSCRDSCVEHPDCIRNTWVLEVVHAPLTTRMATDGPVGCSKVFRKRTQSQRCVANYAQFIGRKKKGVTETFFFTPLNGVTVLFHPTCNCLKPKCTISWKKQRHKMEFRPTPTTKKGWVSWVLACFWGLLFAGTSSVMRFASCRAVEIKAWPRLQSLLAADSRALTL